MQRLRKRLGRLLLACVFASVANTASASEPLAADVPPFPAALESDCSGTGCPDTLHADHDITFISRVPFPAGNALLTRDAESELQRLLVELESFAAIRHIEIIGHADPSGPENYNRWLSKLRAERIQRYFAQSGVDPRKVSLQGAGSSQPLPGAIDPSAHRRVEVRITLQPFL